MTCRVGFESLTSPSSCLFLPFNLLFIDCIHSAPSTGLDVRAWPLLRFGSKVQTEPFVTLSTDLANPELPTLCHDSSLPALLLKTRQLLLTMSGLQPFEKSARARHPNRHKVPRSKARAFMRLWRPTKVGIRHASRHTWKWSNERTPSCL